MLESIINLDQQLFIYLNNLGGPSFDWFWITITNEYISLPLYLLLAWLIYYKKGFKPAVLDGLVLVATVGAAIIISYAFKYGVMRPRPCDLDLPMRYLSHENCKGEFGFISTHATAAMAMMYFFGKALIKHYRFIMWPLMIWVILMGYSRIYVGRHFPGDVICGLIIGYLIGFLGWKVRLRLFKS